MPVSTSKKKTDCIICGKSIIYTTKKPMKCEECKTKSKQVRKPKNRSTNPPKSKWKSEALMFKVLSELFPRTDYCINGYYSWLPSPKNTPMQLDWYSYELGLAFE